MPVAQWTRAPSCDGGGRWFDSSRAYPSAAAASIRHMRALYPLMGIRRKAQIETVFAFEESRPDPNRARRRWSREAVRSRSRDALGRLASSGHAREIADPHDPGMLDVVGFDTATPQLISDFAGGAL